MSPAAVLRRLAVAVAEAPPLKTVAGLGLVSAVLAGGVTAYGSRTGESVPSAVTDQRQASRAMSAPAREPHEARVRVTPPSATPSPVPPSAGPGTRPTVATLPPPPVPASTDADRPFPAPVPAPTLPSPAPPTVTDRVPPAPPGDKVATLPGSSRTEEPRSFPDLVERAREMLDRGDVASARLWLSMASDKGDRQATFVLAQTYDPGMLREWGVMGMASDPARARDLYGIAAAAGVAGAAGALESLGATAPPPR